MTSSCTCTLADCAIISTMRALSCTCPTCVCPVVLLSLAASGGQEHHSKPDARDFIYYTVPPAPLPPNVLGRL